MSKKHDRFLDRLRTFRGFQGPPRPLVRTTQGFARANGGRLLPTLSVTS
jgi:hypothetical protein